MKFDLDKNTDNYILELLNRVNQIQQNSADFFKEDVTKRTPGNGPLKHGWKKDEDGLKTIVHNDVPYLKYVNNGTIFQRGQHFVQAALFNLRKNFQKIVKGIKKK